MSIHFQCPQLFLILIFLSWKNAETLFKTEKLLLSSISTSWQILDVTSDCFWQSFLMILWDMLPSLCLIPIIHVYARYTYIFIYFPLSYIFHLLIFFSASITSSCFWIYEMMRFKFITFIQSSFYEYHVITLSHCKFYFQALKSMITHIC